MDFIDRGKKVTYELVHSKYANIAIVSDKWAYDLTAGKWLKIESIDSYMSAPRAHNENRTFDSVAYNNYDKANKMALAEILESRGYSVPEQVEKFKHADLMAIKDGKEYFFELETRVKFEEVRSRFNSFHIPGRKKDLHFDFYVIFDPTQNSMAIIDKTSFDENKNTVEEKNYGTEKKIGTFICIPTSSMKFYKKIDNQWRKN